jgi:hypothetical protein
VDAAGRPRRRWIVLGVLVVLALLGWWFVERQLQPQRLTTTALDYLGDSLKLDIAFEGTPDYAFKPEPRLRVPNIVVTDPATGKLVLRAKRLEVSMPWATVRGGPLVITRLELDEPTLDVDGLQQWLAARPEAPFELPTLAKGLAVADGTVLGNGWSLDEVDLVVPRLAQGEPVALEYSLQAHRGDTHAKLAGHARLDAASAASRYAVQARVELARDPEPLEAKIDSTGSYRIGDDTFALQADKLDIDGAGPIPTLMGEAWIDKRAQLGAGFRGELAGWPPQWPALPQPIAQADGPYPVVLLYRGRTDFSDPLRLGLEVGPASLDARASVPEMLAWIDAPGTSPLPPLTGTLMAPQLDFEGVTLRGVRAELVDEPAAPPTSP